MDTSLDLIRNMFPENLVQANPPTTAEEKFDLKERGLEYFDGMNVLGVIVFFICFGIVVGQMRDETKVLVDFFSSLEKVIMRIVLYIMKISPFGIFCLISSQIMQVEDLGKTFIGMGVFVLTVFAGLLIHSLITLPLIFFITTRQNPFSFMQGLAQALITGFGISSSFEILKSNKKLNI
uniref:Amino acid transporter n=1 Tax=Ditylenchus dipsaci TaxID=166011 RepID=A0A915EC44_9BILA